MADVFISHSSVDIAEARLLDAALTGAGFSVWWDSHLLAGDRFRESIAEELGRAGVVLVLWSSTSVTSDWVYSEARRGNDRGVLLQVRKRDVTIDDLPAPFDAFHCPFIDEIDAVVDAVGRVLGDGAAPPSSAGLPTGTVTMLFSDIEEATALTHQLGDAWDGVLTDHRRLCRAAWTAHDGVEVGTDRGGFFVVFATAGAAVAAAAAAQRAVAAHPWPPGAEVKLRVGIHTGTPRQHEGGYAGFDVHKTARIRSLAHGGQVVVSDSTAALLGDGLPTGWGLRDLGEHQVEDVPAPVHLHQLTAPDLEAVFPPLRAQRRSTNLPGTLTPLIGRESEIAEVVAMFAGGRSRLVTITGPGGTGKTRLSIAVGELLAGDYADEVCFVALAGVTEVATTWTTIARALDLPADGHLPPGFFDHAAQRRVLLVLDNLEQIPDAHVVVHELLQGAPHLRIVATSRRPLHVAGEEEYPLGTLALPAGDGAREVADSEAGQLFERSAARVRRGFRIDASNAADVAALLRALDGLPLAIQLAATRVKLFNPAALLARLDGVLDLTGGDAGVPERQRTLRAALEWSFRLLSPEEQRLLAWMSVFSGGADIDAVTAVAPPDLGGDPVDVLLALVEASFVVPRYDVDPPRFSLLETVRRFAREHLDQLGETAAARQAHAQHYGSWIVGLRERARAGERATAAFEVELFNLHELLSAPYGPVAHPTEDVVLTPLQLRALISAQAVNARQHATALAWTDPALIAAGRAEDPLGHIECVRTRAFALGMSDSEGARALLATVLDELPAARAATHDGADIASAFAPDLIEAGTTSYLTTVLVTLGRLEEAETVGERALGLPGLLHIERAMVLDALCRVALQRHDYGRAREVALQIRDMDEAAGDSWGLAYDEVSLADIEVRMGDFDRAHARLVAALPQVRLQEDVMMTIGLTQTLAAALAPTAPTSAARAFGAVETAFMSAGIRNQEPEWTEAQYDGLRAHLGAAFDAELARGRASSIDDALEELGSYPTPPVTLD